MIPTTIMLCCQSRILQDSTFAWTGIMLLLMRKQTFCRFGLLLATLWLHRAWALFSDDDEASPTVREGRGLYHRPSYPSWNFMSKRSKMMGKSGGYKPVTKMTKKTRFRLPPKRKDVFTRGRNMWQKSKSSMMTSKSKQHHSPSYRPKKRRHRPKVFYPRPRKGKSAARPRGQPTRRPPYRRPDSPTIPTDFATATAEDPIVLFALARAGTQVVVDLSLPNNNQADALYIVRGNNVEPGSSCPPVGGSPVPIDRRSRTANVRLTGMDSIIALCVDRRVVAQSYFVFETQEDVGGGDEVS